VGSTYEFHIDAAGPADVRGGDVKLTVVQPPVPVPAPRGPRSPALGAATSGLGSGPGADLRQMTRASAPGISGRLKRIQGQVL
jgi:hypothetical protein